MMEFSIQNIIPSLSGMNPITLRFASPELEKEFRIDYTNRSLPLARLAMIMGAVQYVLFHFHDYLIVPLIPASDLSQLLIIRIGVFAFIMAVLGWSFTRHFKKYFQLWVSTVPFIGSVGLICMIYMVRSFDQYHAGIMIIFFYIHVLLRLRFIYATSLSWLIFWMYAIAKYSIENSHLLLVSYSFFLVATQIIGMIASYALEYYARTVFCQNRDLEQRRKQITMAHDLKAAELNRIRDIQLSLLPAEPPAHTDYEVAGSMKTATEIGGDFYDFTVSKNGVLTFAIGDATGHGAKASALVTATKILFVSMANRKDLAGILKKSSAIIRTTGLKMLYMSLAIGRLSGEKLELAGAGMPPAYIWRNSAKQLEKISLNGMPLGAASFPYKVSTVPFYSGDILFMMSDGLPELFNTEGQMYGYKKAQDLLNGFTHMSPSEIVAAVESEITEYSGNDSPSDDVSIIAIKKK